MLRTIIISPDKDLGAKLAKALEALTGEVELCRMLNRYPPAIDVARSLRAHAPEVVFLSFEDVTKALDVVRFLEQEAPGLQIVAMHRVCDAPLLRETMRAGVREFLVDPFERHSVVDALRNVHQLLQRKPPVYESTDHIYAFLPSKAGVGATTLALNVSAALAREKGTRTLLTDLDLNSGMLRFLLKLNNEHSVVDAVEHSLHMDEGLWPQLVTAETDNLDVLHAGRVNPNLRIEPSQVRNLIQFMRRNYQSVMFDLSGNLERYSIEVMQEARRVFLVCTPEIPSLHLAREKLAFLRNLGLDNRIAVVLNRVSKKPLFTKDQVKDLLGLPVAATFSNDYLAVSRATTSGQLLDPDSSIGKQCEEFALGLAGLKAGPRGSGPQSGGGGGDRRKKFLEYFAVPNALVGE